MAASVHDRLLARLRAAGLHLPDGTVLLTLHTGRIQRSQGAWSWAAQGPGGRALPVPVGSQWPMHSLISHEWLIITRSASGDLHVDPLIRQHHYRDAHDLMAIA